MAHRGLMSPLFDALAVRAAAVLALCLSCALVCGQEARPFGDALMVIPADGGEPRKLVELRGFHCESPRWSPDGEWIAFTTTPVLRRPAGLEARDVYVTRAQGGEPICFAEGMRPAWSPDGTMLAWNTAERGKWRFGVVQVAAFDPQAGAISGVEPVRRGCMVTWLDEHTLYLPPAGELFDLATGEAVGNQYPPFLSLEHIGVSRSARRVAYVLETSSREQLRIMDISSDVQNSYRMVRIKEGQTHSVDWSLDEKLLVASWRASKTQGYRLVTLSPYGQDEPQVVAGPDEQRWSIEPSWSPDGSEIVYRSVNMSVGPYRGDERQSGIDR